jgi:hypothetical protein
MKVKIIFNINFVTKDLRYVVSTRPGAHTVCASSAGEPVPDAQSFAGEGHEI